jgi:hypothetical protein
MSWHRSVLSHIAAHWVPVYVNRTLFAAIAVLVAAGSTVPAMAQDWKSGQGSPVHDSDRLYPLSPKRIALENADVRVEFDATTGALTRFENKRSHWVISQRPEMGESFEMFVPMPDRDYNPVLGARNRVRSAAKSPDGKRLTLVWDNLESEYAGTLKIRFEGTVTLDGPQVSFSGTIENQSPYTVSSVEWPMLGDLKPPTLTSTLTRSIALYGNFYRAPVYPSMPDSAGEYGTNFPIQIANLGGSGLVRYILLESEGQGLYVGNQDTTAHEVVSSTIELRPGYETNYQKTAPQAAAIDGHPVHTILGAVHFPFVNEGESGQLATVALNPYQGDWHNGVDIYKNWKATWFTTPAAPAWVQDVNAWQQIQINSPEDDLRTRYSDLPRRAEEAAKNGVAAIQLVGWNRGGQDRDNPLFDVDPRLGTADELKNAIAAIEKIGVHVILFQKYIWADITTDWYKSELHNYSAVDPYGIPYQFRGYEYQTPEQLHFMNTRRFAPACMNDQRWIDLAAKQFRTTLDLGATGMLYDEVFHHGGAFYCFSANHGHHSPATFWPGDLKLGARFREMVRNSVGEDHFLFAGEDPYDLEEQYYTLSYFRIWPGNVPAERYAAPFRPMMIAINGFDDRESINRALMDRYIMSYEPFFFKGNLNDFGLTLNYGKKVDALRKRYKAYLWDAEFRDTVGAIVTENGKAYGDYTVFRAANGKRAVVLVNDRHDQSAHLTVVVEGAREFIAVSPEAMEPAFSNGAVTVPARSAVVLIEK